MPDYIDIEDLPEAHVVGKWIKMVKEWKKIPPNKAIEITLDENKSPKSLVHNLNSMLLRKGVGSALKAELRKGRVFILNISKK